ncbi:MAG: DUF4235 domain-containing protein [Actinomycetota bacterium]|nr:DUF4235 domain-containing protein [Actinomycetota bacterium]
MARKKKSDSPIQEAQAAGAGPSTSAGSKQLWKVYSKGATILSGVLTIQLAQKLWRAAARKEPPSSPEHPEIDVREAIMWALLSGAVAELVKVAVSRKTAQYWVRSTGNLPPDMDPIEK